MKPAASYGLLTLLLTLCFHINSLRAQSTTLIKNSDSSKGISQINPLIVHKCVDFTITGDGSDPQWNKSEWFNLTKLDTGGKNYISRFKILYSPDGIYLLFNGEDEKIATKFDKDFESIFNGDVFEVFFHTDHAAPGYFEYEINALNKELVLVLSRANGKAYSWAPWHYENERSIKRLVNVVGGKAESGSTISSWTAELFFPYELLMLLPDVPPKSGTIWDANFCRLDYDTDKMIKWSWSPTIKKSFHELDQFLQVKFE